MEEREIIALFLARNEQALSETETKYRAYCGSIAMNILANREDAEECVNDTWLRAWQSIPPTIPQSLRAFLGRITRNLALDRYKARHAEKRRGGEFAMSLEELGECVGTEDPQDTTALGESISRFLRGQPREARRIFVCRYFYLDTIGEIAARFGMSESKVKSLLFRMRQRLRIHLEKEGIGI